MKVYNFDNNGYFISEANAKLDPVETKVQEENVYLLPNNATFITPPENQEGKVRKFINGEWVYEDRPIEVVTVKTIDEIRAEKIVEIKYVAGKKIVTAYPEWRQRNHMAAVVDIQNKELIALKANTTYTLSADELAIVAAAQAAKTEIFNIRAKSDELEASLDTMTQEQLEAFDATNDSNWV